MIPKFLLITFLHLLDKVRETMYLSIERQTTAPRDHRMAAHKVALW